MHSVTKLEEARRELEACTSISEQSKKLLLDKLDEARVTKPLGLDTINIQRNEERKMTTYILNSGREIRIMDFEVK